MSVEVNASVESNDISVPVTVYTSPAISPSVTPSSGGGSAVLQTKSETYTPTESAQTDEITPDEGYDGMSKVTVNVDAIPEDYVGSAIDRRSSEDMTISEDTPPKVTAPSGYYQNNAVMTLPQGDASMPLTATGTNGALSGVNPSNNVISVTGKITAKPTVTDGYVTDGTESTTDFTLSVPMQIKTAATITPTAQDQTIASGRYLSGNQTIEGIVCTNLTAANIVSGVTIKIGTATDDDSVLSITGTGGGEMPWSLLATVDVSQVGSGGNIVLNDLDDFTEFMVFADKVQNASSTASSYIVNINDTQLSQGAPAIAKNGTNQYQWTYVRYDGMFWHIQAVGPTINNNYKPTGNLTSPYFYFQNMTAAKKFKLEAPASQYVATSGTVKIWGR